MEAHKKMKKKMKNDELPLTLIESNILPRLPAKSVGRCICVCKQWKSFLSTPMFARMHLRHVTINDYKLLLLDGKRPDTFRTIDCGPLYIGSRTIPSESSPDPSADDIIASLNGLVCLEGWPFKLWFWNPLTGAYKSDYKLLYSINRGHNGAYIYSNRLDSWRKIDFSVGIACSGRPQTTLCGQSSGRWIISFDVMTEKIRKIQGPPVQGGAKRYPRSLVVLHGCIHLCVSYKIEINDIWWKHGDIWRMDGDDGWVKVVAFDDPQPLHKMFTRPHIRTTSTTGNWLAVLDEENKSLKKVNSENFTRHYACFSTPSWEYRVSRMIYVKTLVSPVNP